MQRFAWLLTAAVVLSACTSSPTPTPGVANAQAPVISRFGASPTSGTAPLLVRFFWSISDANRDLMSCELDVAYDGDTFTPDYSVGLPRTRTSNCTSSSRINHTFGPGIHTVALRVCDGANCTIRTQVITASPNPNNRPPVITNFVANPNPAGAGLPTVFSWTVSDPNLDPLTCTFDPDTSTSGNETTVPCNQTHNHTYPSIGNFTAQLSASDGRGGTASQTTSVSVVFAFSQIGTGDSHSCALTPTGNAYCWGRNNFGQLGNGNTTAANTPQAVVMPNNVTFSQISTGADYTCAIGSDSNAYCWGYNSYGQLGNGNTTAANTPQLVSGGFTFTQISAGDIHTCAIGNNQAYCWGYNFYGQLGTGNNTTANTPQLVSGGHTFTQISTGEFYTCSLNTTGSAYCWGHNNNGQLGNGNTGTNVNTPQAVSGGYTFTQIAATESHTCALNPTGNAYCWGLNFYGQLGNGNTGTNANTPQLVSGGFTFSQISTGVGHTCTLSHNNTYCWGHNNNGQLGNGTNTNANTPQAVSVPNGITFSHVSAGYAHTCAITPSGQAYCWGLNNFGQLGTGNTTSANTPQAVVMP